MPPASLPPGIVLDAATRHGKWLGWSGAACLLAGCVLGAAAMLGPPGLARAALAAAAAAWLAAAPLLDLAAMSGIRRSPRLAGQEFRLLGDTPRGVLVGVLAAGSISFSLWAWQLPELSSSLPAALACAAMAFAVLVLERHAATAPLVELPEAASVANVLRAPLAALIAVAVALAIGSPALGLGTGVFAAALVLLILVAAEMVLRVVARAFLPADPHAHPTLVANSVLAGLLLRSTPSLGAMRGAIHRQFGIDLERSWALGFVGRAAPYVVAGTAAVGWLLTGLTALPASQRAVYERLGAPVAVFGPGLHLGLPWPFGTLHRVEFGVVHETPALLPAAGTTATPIAVEALPPQSFDRLWDQSHPGEAQYLVASAARGMQGFQVVDVDLRLVWRIGASSQAARDAAYVSGDPERLLRAAAGRILVRNFASHTLLGLIGEDRDAFASTFRTTLQRELERLQIGIELLAVAFEAIHPPPAAAAAYHDVQAAGVRASVAVRLETGQAAATIALSRQTAQFDRNTAEMEAADLIAAAQVERARFGADQTGYARHPDSFLIERRFDRLAQGLGRAKLVVLDHRLDGPTAPFLDMRSSAPAVPVP